MDDLIARNRLLKEIREVYEHEYPTASGAFDDFVTRIIPNIIKNQTAVDAVPISYIRKWIENHPTDYTTVESMLTDWREDGKQV